MPKIKVTNEQFGFEYFIYKPLHPMDYRNFQTILSSLKAQKKDQEENKTQILNELSEAHYEYVLKTAEQTIQLFESICDIEEKIENGESLALDQIYSIFESATGNLFIESEYIQYDLRNAFIAFKKFIKTNDDLIKDDSAYLLKTLAKRQEDLITKNAAEVLEYIMNTPPKDLNLKQLSKYCSLEIMQKIIMSQDPLLEKVRIIFAPLLRTTFAGMLHLESSKPSSKKALLKIFQDKKLKKLEKISLYSDSKTHPKLHLFLNKFDDHRYLLLPKIKQRKIADLLYLMEENRQDEDTTDLLSKIFDKGPDLKKLDTLDSIDQERIKQIRVSATELSEFFRRYYPRKMKRNRIDILGKENRKVKVSTPSSTGY